MSVHTDDLPNTKCFRLFNSNTCSDLVIRCGDREWPAHSFVLSARSDFFKKAVEGGFKVSKSIKVNLSQRRLIRWKEGIERVIELHDDDPDIFHVVLECMYKFSYYVHLCAEEDDDGDDDEDDDEDEDGDEDDDVREQPKLPLLTMDPAFYIGIYLLADKYLFHALKAEALHRFSWMLFSHQDHAITTAAIELIYSVPVSVNGPLRDHLLKRVAAVWKPQTL